MKNNFIIIWKRNMCRLFWPLCLISNQKYREMCRQTQKVSKTWLAVFYLARYVTANNRKNYRNKPQCANPCNSYHEGLLLLQYLFLSLQLSDWKKETAPILRWFFMKRKRHFLVLSRKLKKTFALLYTIVYNYITSIVLVIIFFVM